MRYLLFDVERIIFRWVLGYFFVELWVDLKMFKSGLKGVLGFD